MIEHDDYVLLSVQERSLLRYERIRALESDLCRARLNYEDALSDAERESLVGDIQAFQARLAVHYRAIGVIEKGEDAPASEEG